MEFFADLHVHSRFSRATAKTLDLENLFVAAAWKGISVVATGDCLHPAWLDEIESRLEPAEPGLYRLRPERVRPLADALPAGHGEDVRFLLETEISNIYKRDGATRKNHNLVYLPDTAAARRLHARLDAIGNLNSDGRPILGLDARDLLEIVLETTPEAFLVPAHAWTPWFSVFGSKSGFDQLADCFRDLSDEIFAVETGLSSDAPMNWRISELDNRALISNSDAHSTATLGRNANRFNTERSFPAIRDALRDRDPDRCKGTIDLHPEEGKYHMDGHRACGVWLHPTETRRREGRCPACDKPVTVGVLHRVDALADRPEGERPPDALPYRYIIPLPEILSELLHVGPKSKKVDRRYRSVLNALGPELPLLLDRPISEIERGDGPELAEAIRRMRAGDVQITPGYDGQYGTVRVFDGADRPDFSGQRNLFPSAPVEKDAAPPDSERNRSHPDGIPPEKQGSPPVASRSRPMEQGTAGDSPSRGLSGEAPQSLSGVDAPLPAASGERASSPDAPVLTATAAAGDPLHGLNDLQRGAVTHTDGPVIIVAGPGSGKTRTLTRRAAWLIRERGVPPESVLAITFTRRAAREMRERIAALLPSDEIPPPVHTFHAFALEFLQAENAFPGALLDETGQESLFREAAETAGIADRRSLGKRRSAISRAKSALLGPEDDPSGWFDLEEWTAIRPIYAAYQGVLHREGAMDFDDLLRETVDLLARDAEVRARWESRIAHLLVDEYQDLNEAQYRLVRRLSPRGEGLCVIGDPDQAIYGFRGADHRYFARFTADYPDARTVPLSRNYRSTETILLASRQMLRDPFPGTTPVHSDIQGRAFLTILERPTERAEAVAIGQAIERMTGGTGFQTVDFGKGDAEASRSFGDIAVLFRSHAVGRGIREVLEAAGIPCQTADRTAALAHPELVPILAVLRLLTGCGAFPDLAAAAALLAPDLRPGPLRTAVTAAREAGMRVADALAAARNGSAPPALAPLRPLASAMAEIPPKTAEPSAEEWMDHLLALSPSPTTADGTAARDAARRAAAAFGNDVSGFLHAAALHADPDGLQPNAERVALLTLHAAKGLEFPVVFIAGCEDGLLPYRRPDGETADLAEERRLLYVGATRAREELFLTRARRRTLYGRTSDRQPSPFLADIAQQLLRHRKGRTVPRRAAGPQQLGLFSAEGDSP